MTKKLQKNTRLLKRLRYSWTRFPSQVNPRIVQEIWTERTDRSFNDMANKFSSFKGKLVSKWCSLGRVSTNILPPVVKSST